jgi:hypothetical protein
MINKKGFILKVLVLLLLASMTITIKASAQVGWESIRRDRMLQIAEAYSTYRWIGSEHNRAHDDETRIHTPDAVLPYPQDDTDHTGWWIYGENIGIPYFWGGSIAIRADEDGLNPGADFGLDPIY